jgi:hypothetical protein
MLSLLVVCQDTVELELAEKCLRDTLEALDVRRPAETRPGRPRAMPEGWKRRMRNRLTNRACGLSGSAATYGNYLSQ